MIMNAIAFVQFKETDNVWTFMQGNVKNDAIRSSSGAHVSVRRKSNVLRGGRLHPHTSIVWDPNNAAWSSMAQSSGGPLHTCLRRVANHPDMRKFPRLRQLIGYQPKQTTVPLQGSLGKFPP